MSSQNFDISEQPDDFDNLESDDSWLDEDFGLEEESDRTIEPTTRELLTLQLLREAIQSQNPNDTVMQDFAEIVLPNLLKYTVGVTAKGGKFFAEYLDRVVNPQRLTAGKPPLKRDNAADQSLNTHLLNGLFPANLIERRLQKLDTTISRLIQEQERRLLLSGFILHDFEKFDYQIIPEMPEKYRVIRRNPEQNIRQCSLEEHREIFTVLVKVLALDKLICPEQPNNWQNYLDDLLFVAYNTQRRNDTNLNLSEDGLNPSLRDRTLRQLADLTCLADRLSSIIKHPQDAKAYGLHEIIHSLSDGQLEFTYHAIAENRGVLTNVVNNALVDAHINLNTPDQQYYTPLLYLPTGVIYLAQREAPTVYPDTLPRRVVNSIKELCAGQLRLRQTGFSRDGKGIKYAEYYNLFFDDPGLMQVALDATLRILNPNKGSVATKRSENLIVFQQRQILSADYDFAFSDDIRIDQLAEFGDLMSRKIWGERVKKIEATTKKSKKKQEQLESWQIPLEVLPDNIIHKIAEFWQLTEYSPQIREIQRINEKLKELKLKGNTGGVPYEWYFLAAKFLVKNPGIEDLRSTFLDVINYMTHITQPIVAQYPVSDGWEDVHQWVGKVVMLPGENPEFSSSQQAEVFLKELAYYNAAKKPGRGRQMICSISHSPYSVSEQMESAVLFSPQVYTNKQHLGGSNAKRNISSIAGIEMMLRQILMNQTQAVGKRFEDGKYRYLYFYPTYYFTPETNSFLHKAYSNIAQTRFDTSIRNHFINNQLEANFSREKYQTVDAFLLEENLAQRQQLPENDPNFKRDRTFKLSYPENKPLTFYFMALPTPKQSKDHKPTDTESWIMPAWLAFAFPMILDVKTVVSESPIPPFTDGSEFEETVFLDSAPQALRILVNQDRFRLDFILEGWTDDGGIKHPAPLNSLTAAYAIHLDVNAKQGKKGYDPNWGKFVELALDLETNPLYIFSYLAKWSRGHKADALSPPKIRLYAHYFYPCFDPYATYQFNQEKWDMNSESPLNHPQKLTQLYREFYRANKRYQPKANAVLKPLDIAAETILKAELSMFHDEALITVVAAEVCKLMDRVHSSTAEGRWVISDREVERQKVLEFAKYFVRDVFEGAFAGDRARLAGRQLNLIRDTCEFLYRLEQDKENQQQQKSQPGNQNEQEIE